MTLTHASSHSLLRAFCLTRIGEERPVQLRSASLNSSRIPVSRIGLIRLICLLISHLSDLGNLTLSHNSLFKHLSVRSTSCAI